MRAVIQRVTSASVRVGGERVSSIGRGFLILLGVGAEDTDKDAADLAARCVALRVFEDDSGRMNRALADVGGEILAVSQFTLFGDARHGRRPSFTAAMEPVEAKRLYELFCEACRQNGAPVQTGVFRADMQVELINDGPVTILMDSRKAF